MTYVNLSNWFKFFLMAEGVLSERGKRKLVYQNYIYIFSKRTSNEAHGIWVCEKRGNCKGRVWTRGLDGPVVKIVTKHNHPAEVTRPEALQVVQQLRNRAANTQEQPQQRIATAVTGIHQNIAASLPRLSSMKRTIHRVRNNNGIPSLPHNLEQLIIPQVIHIL